MLWDGSAASWWLYHSLLVFRVRVAVNAHDWDLPPLHHIAALVAVQLEYTSVFHEFLLAGNTKSQRALYLIFNT
jgi:hypothetical protein